MSVPLCSYMEPGIIILRRRECSHLCLTCRPEPKLRNGPNVEQLWFHLKRNWHKFMDGDLSNIRAGLANLLNFAFFPLAPPLSSRPPIRNWRVFQFPGFVERNFPQSCSFPCFTCLFSPFFAGMTHPHLLFPWQRSIWIFWGDDSVVVGREQVTPRKLSTFFCVKSFAVGKIAKFDTRLILSCGPTLFMK